MRADLLDAQACIDWTNAQFPAFRQRIATWLADNVEIRLEETPAPATHDRVVAIQKSAFPLTFNVEFGAYINVIRSSLDILATALAVRHRVGRDDEAYFPVAKSAAVFASGGYKGSKFVKGLPAAEKAIIESLKPYKGGNETLYALHHLDIMRKHRNLIMVDLVPKGAFAGDDFVPTGDVASGENQKTVIGLLRKLSPDRQRKIAPRIAFDVIETEEPNQVVASLDQFASLAHSIINMFDY